MIGIKLLAAARDLARCVRLRKIPWQNCRKETTLPEHERCLE